MNDETDKTEIELTLVAVDDINLGILLNEEKLFENYLIEDANGMLGLESLIIDGDTNLQNLFRFLLNANLNHAELASNGNKQLFDISKFKENCISFEDLEMQYQDWIELSNRENTMDEYGSLLGLIGYIKANLGKKHLVLISEKGKHCA